MFIMYIFVNLVRLFICLYRYIFIFLFSRPPAAVPRREPRVPGGPMLWYGMVWYGVV